MPFNIEVVPTASHEIGCIVRENGEKRKKIRLFIRRFPIAISLIIDWREITVTLHVYRRYG